MPILTQFGWMLDSLHHTPWWNSASSVEFTFSSAESAGEHCSRLVWPCAAQRGGPFRRQGRSYWSDRPRLRQTPQQCASGVVHVVTCSRGCKPHSRIARQHPIWRSALETAWPGPRKQSHQPTWPMTHRCIPRTQRWHPRAQRAGYDTDPLPSEPRRMGGNSACGC